MNLKDNPEIFANGKFWVKHKDGRKCLLDLMQLILLLNPVEKLTNWTLVARSISDMTEREQKEYDELCEWEYSEYYSESFRIETFKSGLYLLNKGIYPGDQNDFKNKKVLNINDI